MRVAVLMALLFVSCGCAGPQDSQGSAAAVKDVSSMSAAELKQFDEQNKSTDSKAPFAGVVSALLKLPIEDQLRYCIPKSASLSRAAKWGDDSENLHPFVSALAGAQQFELLNQIESKTDGSGRLILWSEMHWSSNPDAEELLRKWYQRNNTDDPFLIAMAGRVREARPRVLALALDKKNPALARWEAARSLCTYADMEHFEPLTELEHDQTSIPFFGLPMTKKSIPTMSSEIAGLLQDARKRVGNPRTP